MKNNKTPYPQAILWDWNGTLLDDFQISHRAVNLLLDEYNMPNITVEQYYSYIDTPIVKFYTHLFDLNATPFEVIGGIFHRHYKRLSNQASLMPGAVEAILHFHNCGIPQYIVSASHKDVISPKAGELGILEFMTDIIGADDYTASSKIERCRKYFNARGIETSKCLIIGDTLHDFSMAKQLCAPCILTTRGHEGYEKLKNCTALITDNMDPDKFLNYYKESTHANR